MSIHSASHSAEQTCSPARTGVRQAAQDGADLRANMVAAWETARAAGAGWVSDTGGALESEVGSGEYRQDEPRVYDPRDLTHYVQAGHDVQAALVLRDLALMGF